MKMNSTTELAPAAPALRSRRLRDVGERMVMVMIAAARQWGKPVGAGQVADINDTIRDWHEALAAVSVVPTWRERIGRGAEFPLHAPNDVERAMEAEIAELRAHLAQGGAMAHAGAEASHV